MATKVWTGQNVFDAALERLVPLFEDGHRLVVSFSAGKDSGVCLEVCRLAAEITGRLPLDVVMRDEEIMLPGTYEYAERVARRPDLRFHWLITRHAIVNVFNRADPWWWTFDPRLPPERWVRTPPPDLTIWLERPEPSIERMTIPERFPPPPGKELIAVLGLRTQESTLRHYRIFSTGGFLSQPNRYGVRNAAPIYDWTDGDVWWAISNHGWDYNRAYDVLHRLGVPRTKLRMAPPTLNTFGISQLQLAARAWPRWFDRVCQRLPGVRAVALFGLRAVTPQRRHGESWQQVFERECLGEQTPPFVRARAELALRKVLSMHRHHSTAPLPEVRPCRECSGSVGAWKRLALALYNGDPLNSRIPTTILPDLEKSLAPPWETRDG
jgi:predicted phosphoadenosine phosphosulfate sulfurtransferase